MNSAVDAAQPVKLLRPELKLNCRWCGCGEWHVVGAGETYKVGPCALKRCWTPIREGIYLVVLADRHHLSRRAADHFLTSYFWSSEISWLTKGLL